MESFAKFNKASLGFYNDIIHDFSKKVKEAIPEEYHSAIDELMVSNQKMLVDAKKVNNKMKKKSTPSKKKSPSGWNLFYKEKQSSVEVSKQENKMSLVGELWKALSDEEKEEWNTKAKANASSDTEPQSDTEVSSDTEPQSDTEEAPQKKAPKKAPAKKTPAKKASKKAPAKKTPAKKASKKAPAKKVDEDAVDDDMPIMEASD